MDYSLRFYRDWVKQDGLVSFEVKLRETDLAIRAHSELSEVASDELRRIRTDIELYGELHPGFIEAMTPVSDDPSAPEVVREMMRCSTSYGVGPMAAVAGAVAEAVGRRLLEKSPEVVVENGGDVFLLMNRPVRLMLYSGEESPFGIRARSRCIGMPLLENDSTANDGWERSQSQGQNRLRAYPNNPPFGVVPMHSRRVGTTSPDKHTRVVGQETHHAAPLTAVCYSDRLHPHTTRSTDFTGGFARRGV